ncbi:MAG: 50S ribosomal protein L29 [Candidatus Saccharibacteria bacterium]|nr:50S ribosomal protein L29 [Candidatus Saccharibacteria bacterium]
MVALKKKADEKATKATVKKSDAKVDLKKLSVEELQANLLIARRSLFEGTLTNPHMINSIKKEIARKLTAQNAKEGK